MKCQDVLQALDAQLVGTLGRADAEAMKEAIEGYFGGRVQWVESASRDTAENAAYSAAILKAAGITRVALVSHAWHLRRAVPLFERQGLDVMAAPTGFTTGPPSPFAAALYRVADPTHECGARDLEQPCHELRADTKELRKPFHGRLQDWLGSDELARDPAEQRRAGPHEDRIFGEKVGYQRRAAHDERD